MFTSCSIMSFDITEVLQETTKWSNGPGKCLEYSHGGFKITSGHFSSFMPSPPLNCILPKELRVYMVHFSIIQKT